MRRDDLLQVCHPDALALLDGNNIIMVRSFDIECKTVYFI